MDYEFLSKIVSSETLHAQWLNALSYLENCGARKIAACEHPQLVRNEMLKHACEEFRHAYYLKQQMKKLKVEFIENYQNLLGGLFTKNYLNRLEVEVCRLLKVQFGWSDELLQENAYICVTYAIEVRAAVLYPLYQNVLKEQGSPVSVRMLILEEDQHLEEMEKALGELKGCNGLKEMLCQIEVKLYQQWSLNLALAVECGSEGFLP